MSISTEEAWLERSLNKAVKVGEQLAQGIAVFCSLPRALPRDLFVRSNAPSMEMLAILKTPPAVPVSAATATNISDGTMRESRNIESLDAGPQHEVYAECQPAEAACSSGQGWVTAELRLSDMQNGSRHAILGCLLLSARK